MTLAILAAVASCTAGPGSGLTVSGDPPTYGPPSLSVAPNEAAIDRHIWVPGLDDYYDPQGLAVAGGSLLVSSFYNGRPNVNVLPCRVFRIDPLSGRQTGAFDIAAPCRHAGGIATTGQGIAYIADTQTLFEINLANAFAAGGTATNPPPVRSFPLGPGLVGSLAASGPDQLWLGTYIKQQPGHIFRFPRAILRQKRNGETLTREDADLDLAIPSYAQGAAIDPDGRIVWISRSDLDWATLDMMEIATGRLLRRFPAPGGLEGIAFDDNGRLWAVSEAGARRYYEIPFSAFVLPFYPLIFAFDPARLRPE